MPRILLFITILLACNTHKKSKLDLALEANDTLLAKQLAQKDLDSLRATITDSTFATVLDGMLQVQKLEWTLQKSDSSRQNINFSNELIADHPDGQRLYDLMMKSYKLGLKNTSYSFDISYFTNQIVESKEQWIKTRFANKKTYDALISLKVLQRDIALISAIINKSDDPLIRSQITESYSNQIKILQSN